jgi:hypothetical protein
MFLKRLMLPFACLLLVFGGAGVASAAPYSLGGTSGGQLQIGGGLPLPIQATNPAATGTVFPTLLIPPAPGAVLSGTTVMATKQRLVIPPGVLSKPSALTTVGVFGQNPTLYAVATNLNYVWPATTATLSTGARTGAKTTTFTTVGGNNIRYSNVGATKFGGPARFALNAGPAAGKLPTSPVTIYAIAVPPAGNPPCTHTALTPVPFPGPGNPACVAALAEARPTGLAAIGGPVSNFVATTPVAPLPGVGVGKFGAAPAGTVTFFTFTPAGTMAGFTNAAQSRGFPHTTGKLTISAPFAAGAPEVFTITGMDSRTVGGAGTIQLVSGAVSQRTVSGPNSNRGWVRLELIAGQAVPAMSGGGIALLSVSVLAAGLFAFARRGRRA